MIDERRAGKRLIVLIIEQIKINTSQSEGEVVVVVVVVLVLKGTVVIAQEWILLELQAVAKAQWNRSHLNANSDKGQLD